LRIETDW